MPLRHQHQPRSAPHPSEIWVPAFWDLSTKYVSSNNPNFFLVSLALEVCAEKNQSYLLSFQRSAYKVGSRLAFGNSNFRCVPTIPRTDKTVSLCLNSASNMVYAQRQPSLWSLEFGYVPSRGCLCDQPQIKTLGTESLISLSAWQHFIHQNL